MKLKLTLIALFFFSYFNISNAAVFNVSTEVEFQNALDTAGMNGENDTINISSGTYNPMGIPFTYVASPGENFSLTINGEDAETTRIDGLFFDSIFSITVAIIPNDNAHITVTNLTIERGASPGGLFIDIGSSDITVEDCVFDRNATGSTGGGIGITAGNSEININNNIFTSNNASGGGGAIAVLGSGGTINLNDNGFTSNASSNDDGGAVFLQASEVLLSGNVFDTNDGNNDGGAAVIQTMGGSGLTTVTENSFINNNADMGAGGALHITADDAVIMTNKFESNLALDDGGAVFILANNSATVTANNFRGNNTSGQGGGLLLVTNQLSSVNNVFIDNTAVENGGAIAFAIDGTGSAEMINNTFTMNTADINGGAIIATFIAGDMSTGDFINNIFFLNNAFGIGDDIFFDDGGLVNDGAIINILNNNINSFFSQCTDDVACTPNITEANSINQNPFFVDAPGGDVSLEESSPVVDMGDNSNCPDVDINGTTRPQDGDEDTVAICDMGAIELILEALQEASSGDGSGGCAVASSNSTVQGSMLLLLLPLIVYFRRFLKRDTRLSKGE